jgi:hypothetical protein
MRLWTGWCVTLMTAMACSKTPAPNVDPESADSDVAVRIENHGWSDVVILFSHQGVSERLGMASAAKSTNFFIPWSKFTAGGVVRLQADPADGSRGLSSEGLLLQPGMVVVWTLEHELDHSRIAVY